ncbi:pyruvate phosphate dikinase [Tritrichomonas foetus]|uniref:Pyruvate phosphate dikinase n=1 Tax=Tritrichomonas foetus TaxID=1144522 RepID=A0A1J4JMF0_9EUKA|nr:pyruvate phosphate dikinase [Tritrichomonas foetus]|eukprot:OHS98436.1 pyruvate phosphate dikinase [Tritrichomonas foetus]
MPMLFGNRSITTSSTVLATRNLVTGEPNINGEFAVNATCRDIVISQRDPLPLETLSKENSDVFNKINNIAKTLEKYFKKPQIIDYIYENGEVYVIQSNNAQLTAPGRFRAAKDMVDSGIITKAESLNNFEPADVAQLLAPSLTNAEPTPFCKGIPSGKACVVGKVCLTNESVLEAAKKGESPIFFKKSIASTDFEALMASSAVVTNIGTDYSFVSAVTRLFRKTAAIGCEGLIVDLENNVVKCGSNTLNVGDKVTVTGTGSVLVDEQELFNPEKHEDEFAKEVLTWADEVRQDKINVFTIADTSSEVQKAVEIGSDGVGTLSLEPFFEGDDRRFVTDVIDPTNEEGVNSFETHLTSKLKEIFSSIGSKAITIRLFDPELTSYLDKPMELAKEIGVLRAQKDRDGDNFASQEELDSKIAELDSMKKAHRANPAIGSRSIRLLVARPELMNAELKSILNAAKEARGSGADPHTRILIPYVSDYREVSNLMKQFEALSLEIGEKAKIGIEIDTPRACLTTAKLAELTDFLIFSVPLLTNVTFALDRTEAEKQLLETYKEKKLLTNVYNGVQASVSELMKICVQEAKQTKTECEIGLFSEEFHNPKVISHYSELGINSFICKAPAVPVARLCAAKTLIESQ